MRFEANAVSKLPESTYDRFLDVMAHSACRPQRSE